MFLKVLNSALKTYKDDEGKAIATAWKAINDKYGRRDEFHTLTSEFNIDSGLTETETYIDIPTIFTREGVQNHGLKPFAELSKSARSLEGKPAVFGHPESKRPVDASRDWFLGECHSVKARRTDRTLHGVTRLFKDQTPSHLIQSIKTGDSREGSVGYWSDSDLITGEFKGQPYKRIERNMRFDHYAVGIPLGACSVAEGCGLGFDEKKPSRKLFMDALKGTKTVCLEKVKDWLDQGIKNIFSGQPDQDVEKPQEGDEKNMTEETDFSKYEKQIDNQKKTISTLTEEKKQLSEKLSGFEEKMKKEEEAQRKSLIEAIIEETGEDPSVYAEWDLKHIRHMKDKLSNKTRIALIKEITESTGDETDTFKNWSVSQLEVLKKRVVKNKPEGQPADKKALTPSSGAGKPEGKTSIEVRGKALTVGDLMKQPESQ